MNVIASPGARDRIVTIGAVSSSAHHRQSSRSFASHTRMSDGCVALNRTAVLVLSVFVIVNVNR